MHPALGHCSICENHTKFYFDTKHLEKGMNWRSQDSWCHFFSKKSAFWDNIGRCPNFLD